MKIDHFDPREKVVKETKKSPKLKFAHVAQVKYYLYLLELRGIKAATGQVEYPRQKRTTEVSLLAADRDTTIPGWLAEIERITQLEKCPEIVRKSYCRSCAFHDFCFS
ncbi:CRISPR-associated exonuclease Cas4 [Lewinella marina]|uniref:Dna2/Cas4 domain-containing protein n=1 Tax=Neolewinella marina TaxID=438751 RepID=UPI0014313BE9|nr:Dna2/Cas4 domain-containing protein [Neolewinella marina]NJB84459.1 CRISPR-associated exonuclease Cas4 [Neolewinella marina]